MDNKIFGIWIAICIGGFLFWGMSNETDTSDTSAFDQCLADNNIQVDSSVFDNYLANIPEPTEEMANEYIKEYLEKGEATFGGKEAEKNNKMLSDEIKRYINLIYETCGHKLGSSN